MMDTTGGGTTLITSPFRKGDVVDYEGESYQVIEFLECSTAGVCYRVRGIKDKGVVMDITLPFVARNHDLTAEENEVHFQIVELIEDNEAEVILKPWSEEGQEKKMKVRWAEDVEMIRDGLTRDDKEVFCTVGKFVGKEVLGNIKILPKDPPILKMPDLVMDMIFSNLSPEDRLQCRLVTPGWAFEVLPINGFVTLNCLSLERGGSISGNFMPNRRSRCAKDMQYLCESVSFNNLELLVNNSLLQNMDWLEVDFKSRPESDLQIILDHCRNITNVDLSGKVDQPESADTNWTWAKKFISAHAKQLESLTVHADIREMNFSDDLHTGDCTSLKTLSIMLSRTNSILRNLESLPCSITSLELRDVSVPLTKPQMLWIAAHLPQLTSINVTVHHHHDYFFGVLDVQDDDDNELDDNTMLELMNRLPLLQHMELRLTSPSPTEFGAPHSCCDKAKQLKSRLDGNQYHNRKVGESDLGVSSRGRSYWEEVLTVTIE